MHQKFPELALLTLFLSGVVVSARLSPELLQKLPPAAPRTVNFSQDIKPILEASCVKCHGRGKSKGGYKIDTRETTLKGGDSGPAVLSGKSSESYFIELVSGLDPENVMPQKGSKLTRDQVALMRAWIDQGASWDDSVQFGPIPPANFYPPKPKVAVGKESQDSANGIDLVLKSYFAQHRIDQSKLVSDTVFARRVYLDVIGVLPNPRELESFLRDASPGKRAVLVKSLLSDNARYATHWLTFWNDLLRNDYKGTGYIDEGRKQITDWLYTALARNLPYDQFVSQLINPTPESEGFVKGIVWRGVVNASQTPQMQAAQNISQVFMGINLKCASCHDSFISDWTLADAYGLASVYADGELEMVQCDRLTGKKAAMKFLYPELGSIDPKLPKKERLQQLASIMVRPENGRLTRTMVNRLWGRFMGHGLVEPVDDMEQPAWNSELLDWLAADLVANHFDLKKTIEHILTSVAYQLPTVPATEAFSKDYVFRGPLVRRLSAEQFEDALASVTGAARSLPNNTQVDYTSGLPQNSLSELEHPAGAVWIWDTAGANERAVPGTVFFRRKVNLSELPTQAAAVITCDNSYKLFVNGKDLSSSHEHTKPKVVDLLPHLKVGENILAVSGVNDSAAPSKPELEQANPAGLMCYVRIRSEGTENGYSITRIWDVATDKSWLCTTQKVEQWEQLSFDDSSWTAAVELGKPNMAPWNLEPKLGQALSAAALAGHVRSALAEADPLEVALGRPNREQVVTVRSSGATTLQALEMTNGKTLADGLKRGAEKLLSTSNLSPRDMVVTVFQRALGRTPKPDELKMAEDLVGAPARREGVEDLLWAVTMLPEFQLIY